MKTYAFRLKPREDLRCSIDKFVSEKNIKAGILLSCVGNLEKATVRMADASIVKVLEDPAGYEIISIVGTLESGNSHLHISISDKDGIVYGGHLKKGSIVGVTAEIVIGELERTSFQREFDENTGYEELIVSEE